MKTHLFIPAAALLSLAPLASLANAQEKPGTPPVPPPSAPSVTETTETTRKAVLPDPSLTKMEGKIHLMDPETKQLLLRTKLGKAPIGLTCNASTRFIDLDGKPVDVALLKPETPVEVNFAENGNELIAAKVVVQRIQVPLPGGAETVAQVRCPVHGFAVGAHRWAAGQPLAGLRGCIRILQDRVCGGGVLGA